MKTFEIKADLRESLGKKATKKLRLNNQVPCVMYGGDKTVHFVVPANVIKKIVFTPNVYILKVEIAGNVHNAVLQDIQFNPVTDEVIHIDFVEFTEGQDVSLNVPVNITGESEGIKKGGKLRINKRSLRVKGLAVNVPDVLDIDITALEIGDSFKVKDLSYDNLTILDPAPALVVAVASSRLAKSAEEEEAEGSEGATEEATEETTEK